MNIMPPPVLLPILTLKSTIARSFTSGVPSPPGRTPRGSTGQAQLIGMDRLRRIGIGPGGRQDEEFVLGQDPRPLRRSGRVENARASARPHTLPMNRT